MKVRFTESVRYCVVYEIEADSLEDAEWMYREGEFDPSCEVSRAIVGTDFIDSRVVEPDKKESEP